MPRCCGTQSRADCQGTCCCCWGPGAASRKGNGSAASWTLLCRGEAPENQAGSASSGATAAEPLLPGQRCKVFRRSGEARLRPREGSTTAQQTPQSEENAHLLVTWGIKPLNYFLRALIKRLMACNSAAAMQPQRTLKEAPRVVSPTMERVTMKSQACREQADAHAPESPRVGG